MIEFSLCSAEAKLRAEQALRGRGYGVESGPVRLAYPFAISVDAGSDELDAVWHDLRTVDPTVGLIVVVDDGSAPLPRPDGTPPAH